MTGGRALILGRTGRNFAAGMSGGIAFVVDGDGQFKRRCNLEMVDLEALGDIEDIGFVHVMLMKHVTYTGSRFAARLLEDWPMLQRRIVKVMPREYKRALAADARRRATTAATENVPFVAYVASDAPSVSSVRL